MKIETTLIIDKPLDIVAKYFADPTYLKEYQEGFVSKELVSGTAGENGAVSNMLYEHNGQKMELIETITANNLPDTFEAHYHHEHMDNTMKCTFTPLDDGRTEYRSFIEYTRINWVMPRLMAILVPSLYKKPVKRWLENFKRFVESR
ncbi:SRPBCC family protein [Reichenbachiella sp.]|uniref:SRPBCC family protein n=1 Tax=Reichenbachiella sp. TaxID=2184521 RepID=UPI003B59B5F1